MIWWGDLVPSRVTDAICGLTPRNFKTVNINFYYMLEYVRT